MKKIIGMLIGFVLTTNCFAQVIGFEYGVAGVENFDPVSNGSILISIPFNNNQKWIGDFSFSTWTGEDGNLKMLKKYHPDDELKNDSFFGNFGFNLTIQRHLVDYKKVKIFFGAGLGNYHKRIFDEYGNENVGLIPSATLSSTLKYQQNDYLTYYVRSTLSSPFGNDFIYPHWGLLNIGVSIINYMAINANGMQ